MDADQKAGRCEHCLRTFAYRIIHNGFGDSAYAYCDRCCYTVVVDAWSKRPMGLEITYQRRLPEHAEAFLRPCPCGGTFRANEDPKCPHCGLALSAELATSYIEANAPGTSKGWRWDRRWDGLYSIIIEESVVENWWKTLDDRSM